jgi:hypothetical protein
MHVLPDTHDWKNRLPQIVEGGAKVFTAVVFVAIVGVGFRTPSLPRLAVAERRATSARASGPSLADYQKAIVGRPLLHRGIQPAPIVRKPAAPPVPSVPPPPPKPTLAETAAEWLLVGIANTGDVQAILSNKKTKETIYVQAGQHVGDMTVQTIDDAGVTLARDGETTQLKL